MSGFYFVAGSIET